MDRKTLIQLAAFIAASYLACALVIVGAIKAIDLIKEIQAMCICPTTELPQQGATKPSLIAELIAKIDEAKTYIEFHHPDVVAQIKAMGIDVPAFSINAPVMVDLRKALERAAPVLELAL